MPRFVGAARRPDCLARFPAGTATASHEVFGVWTAIAVTGGAAGTVLTKIVDTKIPEAVAETHDWPGLLAMPSFLISFALTALTG